MKTSEDLTQAAEKIERDGWWNQNLPEYEDGDCGTCAGLAINSSMTTWKFAEWLGFKPNSDNPGGAKTRYVFDWNDSQPNPQIVIATLRSAASYFRAQGE